MKGQPLSVEMNTSLDEASCLMRQRGIRHLPVVDAAGRLMGMLTDRDVSHAAFVPALAKSLAWDPRRLQSPRVRDVMTWSVVATDPDASLIQAGLTMFQRRIGSLPVVEHGRLVGILTDRDVLAALQVARQPDADSEDSVVS
jgi:acetoin utilization protein AcuB